MKNVNLKKKKKEVLKTLSEPNGNGTVIGTNKFEYDYLCIFCFSIDNKTLRGVLSSLVKKELIIIESEGVDDIGELSTVRFTEKGFELAHNL